jgi:hypothetical protein
MPPCTITLGIMRAVTAQRWREGQPHRLVMLAKRDEGQRDSPCLRTARWGDCR